MNVDPEGLGPARLPDAGQNTRLTCRQFSRVMAGSAAGLLLGSAAAAETGEAGNAAAPQETPADKASTPEPEDPRIARLEKERGAPFTSEQRAKLPAQLKDLDESSTALRKFPLSDGGSEPRFVFHPERAQRRTRRK
ncbi:MAG TPA: hypothetical protein VFB38_02940 [Chthonomonadaceae bacterium]|nr:hypothetical protein [Chthonomonadaceae bacterium]